MPRLLIGIFVAAGLGAASLTGALTSPAHTSASSRSVNLALYHNGWDSFYRSPFGAAPTDSRVTLRLRSSRGVTRAALYLVASNGSKKPYAMTLQTHDATHDFWSAAITMPAKPTALSYHFRVQAGKTVRWYGDKYLVGDNGPGQTYSSEGSLLDYKLTVYLKSFRAPAWMKKAVVYHIFLDRFHPGTPGGTWQRQNALRERHGGTLAGVHQALPYLAELGVTCLWLSPLLPSDTYHRYDGTDYFNVDPALGTNQDLRALVDAAHGLGIRVLLDFVPSHCSRRHPAFIDAQKDQSAATASWFTFDRWPDDYRCFLQRVRHLPSFSTDDPGARTYLIESAVHWVSEFGIDGFRLDHAIGPSMDFWVALRDALERVQPETATVGEVTDTPDSLRRYRNRLHGVLDFPLAQALRLTFATGGWDVGQLDAFLDAYERYMLEGPGRVSFLDNHDMDRFLYLAGGDVARLKLGALCQFTLDATPTIYYGTEIGMSQEHSGTEIGYGGDAQARRDMPWNPSDWDRDLLTFYRTLVQLRRAQPALQHGSRRRAHLDCRAGTYAYIRKIPAERDGDVMVAFNLGGEAQRIPLPEGSWHALLATNDLAEVEGTRLCLPAGSGALLRDGGAHPGASGSC